MNLSPVLSATMVLLLAAAVSAAAAELPVVEVTKDDTIITKSCRIRIAPGTVLRDEKGDGMIRIEAPNVEVEFEKGSVLRGSAADALPDTYEGVAIRIDGQAGVTVRGAVVSGFRCAVWASKADGLTLEGVDASDNRRAHLRSTPAAEDGADWLFPHNNEDRGWLKQYAAAIYVDTTAKATIRNCRVRHGQNALCLDRVTESKIYDNDFSFNSGWGIAMWRCTHNVISRNAVDFCVRGYSHMVYNRGQDSAGILMFEQDCNNVIAENSVTHGGDGIFGFAGREAIGDTVKHDQDWYRRRGCNDNVFLGNDLSYAPAHGLEMTFSFGNQILNNRFAGNAICGIWGGYSQQTTISGNTFEGNGEMGYGLERGGVNIEHGKANRVLGNTFTGDRCGVHLWWNDADFLRKPWGLANQPDSVDNVIAGNTFTGEQVVFHFRGKSEMTMGPNTIKDAGKEMTATDDVKIIRKEDLKPDAATQPTVVLYGKTHPVGARPELRGRQNIIMTEWGPWDHASPLVRQVPIGGGAAQWEMHKMPAAVQVRPDAPGLEGALKPAEGAGPALYTLRTTKPGAGPYALEVTSGDFHQKITGALVTAKWHAVFFPWTKDTDPRKDLEAYRKLATGPDAAAADLDELRLKYGMSGPKDLKLSQAVIDSKLTNDHFGMIATTKLPLTKGKWRFTTLSDDGVRVIVDGKPLIENWTWHTPTKNVGTLDLPADKTVEITVEHFEIDGFAVLEFDMAPEP